MDAQTNSMASALRGLRRFLAFSVPAAVRTSRESSDSSRFSSSVSEASRILKRCSTQRRTSLISWPHWYSSRSAAS